MGLSALCSQILHYINFKHNTKPSYLRVFEMISGSVPPQKIGISDEKELNKLIKLFKLLSAQCESMTSYNCFLVTFIICIIPFALNYTVFEFIFFGIPYIVLFIGFVHFTESFNYWQMIYFITICYYLKIKIRLINSRIISGIRENRIDIKYITNTLNSIHSEIHEYNINYWSKYLFALWMTFTMIVSSFLYFAFFMKEMSFVRFNFIHGAAVFGALLTIVLNFASSVNSEAFKSYKILNTCVARLGCERKSLKMRLQV
jgi:hypothetical protein